MLRVPTALLLHTTPDGCHYDWLIGTPEHGADPEAGLWTARVNHPSGTWRSLGRLDLTVIDPHRSVYLDYQGPISGGRGHVRRVDQGVAVIHLWRVGLVVLDIRMQHFQGRLEIGEVATKSWRARIIG